MESTKPDLADLLTMLRERGVVTSGLVQNILDEYEYMVNHGQCVCLVWETPPPAAAEPEPEPKVASVQLKV